jgi:hypothetical protein
MTQTIIHEVGHEFGLSHPHNFGNIGDFITSPMGYFTTDYKFQLFDKDALWRAHVDELYLQSEAWLSKAPPGTLVTQAQSKLAEVDAAYSNMNYLDAIQPAVAAYQLAAQAAGVSVASITIASPMPTYSSITSIPTASTSASQPSGGVLSSPQLLYMVIGVVVLAIVLIIVLLKPRKQS